MIPAVNMHEFMILSILFLLDSFLLSAVTIFTEKRIFILFDVIFVPKIFNIRESGIMSNKTKDFDNEARFWDENPGRVNMARNVADVIKANIVITDKMEVLDFGCGTGLITLQFQPFVKMITGADSSQGMLDILASKIENLELKNVRIIYMENGNLERLKGKYDLIVSSMTLHHIKETAPLIMKFNEILKPGGTLCIADLDPDDGLFHSDNTGVFHYGFERGKLKAEFERAGFIDVKDTTAAEVPKPLPGGGERNFSLFLIYGKKK